MAFHNPLGDRKTEAKAFAPGSPRTVSLEKRFEHTSAMRIGNAWPIVGDINLNSAIGKSRQTGEALTNPNALEAL
jgi:hypothetical protein